MTGCKLNKITCQRKTFFYLTFCWHYKYNGIHETVKLETVNKCEKFKSLLIPISWNYFSSAEEKKKLKIGIFMYTPTAKNRLALLKYPALKHKNSLKILLRKLQTFFRK